MNLMTELPYLNVHLVPLSISWLRNNERCKTIRLF